MVEESDSSAEEMSLVPALREEPPAVIIAAHNGFNFDMPILFAELLRSGIGLEACQDWYFVDTLHVVRALGSELTGGCVKLQCLLTRLQASDGGLQAHRALDCEVGIVSSYELLALPCIDMFPLPQDDCYALRRVVGRLAGVLDVSALTLLSPFTVSLDKDATLVALSCLL